jgi:hypothetical protein
MRYVCMNYWINSLSLTKQVKYYRIVVRRCFIKSVTVSMSWSSAWQHRFESFNSIKVQNVIKSLSWNNSCITRVSIFVIYVNNPYFDFMNILHCFEIHLNQGHKNDVMTVFTLYEMQRMWKNVEECRRTGNENIFLILILLLIWRSFLSPW